MRTEFRFLLAIVLMMGVLVGTNILFPPTTPEPQPGQVGDTAEVAPGATPDAEPGVVDAGATEPGAADTPSVPTGDAGVDAAGAEVPPTDDPTTDGPAPPPVIPGGGAEDTGGVDAELTTPEAAGAAAAAESREVVVESPLYRYTFSTLGAQLVSARLLEFESFAREGPVELIPEGTSALGSRLVLGSDTLDLRRVPFEVSPAGGLHLEEGDAATELAFTYQHPTAPFRFSIVYTFQPGSYVATARGRVEGLPGAALYTGLGSGLAFNERQRGAELQAMAYVGNHLQEGIDSWNLTDVEDPFVIHEGPFLWAAFKSKYFVLALLPGAEEEAGATLGGIIARDVEPAPGFAAAVGEEDGEDALIAVTTTLPIGADDAFAYRVFMGPQDFARLTAIGEDLEDVNPYGWRFFRPVIRPLVGIVMAVLTFLHDTLGWGYGWVLILFGIMMRVLLFPLYQKSMRAQLRNQAVQPLLKEIQKKYKDQPEKLQKEMMKLYKEHGFNPLAGCLPMLLPWPVLITLFFVFQNTIELRGVPFLWMPDLASADPLYILPIVMGISMFLLQYISYRAMDEPNPQMKMMMWLMPGFMVFLFLSFPAGLNLYYVTTNVATLPQTIWIANERKKTKKHAPASSGESAEESVVAGERE